MLHFIHVNIFNIFIPIRRQQLIVILGMILILIHLFQYLYFNFFFGGFISAGFYP